MFSLDPHFFKGNIIFFPLKIQIFNSVKDCRLLHYRHRIYYVSGNHEYYYGDARKWFSEFGRHGIEVLNNKYVLYKHSICDASSTCCVSFFNRGGGGGSCYRGYKLLQGCLVVIRTLAPGRIPTHKLTLLSGQEATLLHGSRCLIEM